MTVEEFVKNYGRSISEKLADFLFTDVGDSDDIALIKGFLSADDTEKKLKYGDMLNTDTKRSGIFLDGNQYAIASDGKTVHIIDTVAEEFGGAPAELSITVAEMCFLLDHKDEFIHYVSGR
ncbi:hypothetical protein [Ruminococcus sp.]|uniref:hypothetical protein n=1 Tax=Ruminococcus sp. TaxID=41978 RepID=UPI0025F4A13A|nr:hypothetical protein [Ruminococcus sp.]MBQ8966229.1 hypothetical protein [Ruminococcus sp.]